jgi:hypothetical protein
MKDDWRQYIALLIVVAGFLARAHGLLESLGGANTILIASSPSAEVDAKYHLAFAVGLALLPFLFSLLFGWVIRRTRRLLKSRQTGYRFREAFG